MLLMLLLLINQYQKEINTVHDEEKTKLFFAVFRLLNLYPISPTFSQGVTSNRNSSAQMVAISAEFTPSNLKYESRLNTHTLIRVAKGCRAWQV